jgi:hypothetical protein
MNNVAVPELFVQRMKCHANTTTKVQSLIISQHEDAGQTGKPRHLLRDQPPFAFACS